MRARKKGSRKPRSKGVSDDNNFFNPASESESRSGGPDKRVSSWAGKNGGGAKKGGPKKREGGISVLVPSVSILGRERKEKNQRLVQPADLCEGP